MAYDGTAVTAVSVGRHAADLLVSWSSAAPPGTVFQVYVDGALVWHGTARQCVAPTPARTRGRVEVGAVGSTEGPTDFSSSLPPPPGGGARARLRWRGGSYLGSDIQGFRVYSGRTAGAAVDMTNRLADLTAYDQGVVLDGFGMGGFGAGGFGRAAGDYAWEGEPLAPGTWHFAVVSYDAAGNESTAWTPSVAVAGPPGPPAPFATGPRVRGVYSSGPRTVALTWNPPV